jgi:hypothetical protein
MTVLLPDLSEFQPHADMPAIRAKNGGAAIIRACYGTSHPDHAFRNLRSSAAGFSFLGIYQYVVAGQGIPAQASAFCDTVGTLGAHEFPVMDLEEGDGDQSVRAAEWLTTVGLKLHKRPWLYSGLNYAETHGLAPIFNGPEVHTWVAAYGSTEPTLGHTLWQSTNGTTGAHITDWPGAGKCDTSLYHGTLAELSALIPGKTPLPKRPVPEYVTHVTAGHMNFHDLCAQHGTTAAHVLRLTAKYAPFTPETYAWLNDVFSVPDDSFPGAPMPPGLTWRVPVNPS